MNTKEIIAESRLRERGICNFWTTRLVEKYLRKYDLGPGPTEFGRAKHRYRKADIRAAMSEAREQEPRDNNGLFIDDGLAYGECPAAFV